VFLAGAFLAAPSAGAGGWAVTTLDAVPTDPVAGTPVDIGYTIRQHGVTPVELDGTAIVVHLVDGPAQRFVGRPDGVVGHYVATVTFPTGGMVRWGVEQGWFAPQDLGTIQVRASGAAAAVDSASPTAAAVDAGSAGSSRWPAALRWSLAGATALALVGVGAGLSVWRQRRAEATPLRPA
jgi:hypothetical protein